MKLVEVLQENKKQIVSTWVERTLDSYTSSEFFKKSKDQFANPVGSNILNGLTQLFEKLLTGAEKKERLKVLDQVIRIRAVQEFTPAQAVAPILELKWIIRQIVIKNKKKEVLRDELDSFDYNIDCAALEAFDIYMQCRERLYQTRINELKSGSYILTDTPCSSKLIRTNRNNKNIDQ